MKEKRSNHTDFDHGIYDNLLFRSKKNQDEFIPWTVTGSLYSGAGFIQQWHTISWGTRQQISEKQPGKSRCPLTGVIIHLSGVYTSLIIID